MSGVSSGEAALRPQMGQPDGQRVGRVGRRGLGQPEQRAHHEGDLGLLRAAASDDRLFDLARGILVDRETAFGRREDRRAARRAHRDRRLVALHEDDAFHRATVRLVFVDDLGQPVVDRHEARTRQQIGLVLDRAVFNGAGLERHPHQHRRRPAVAAR